MITFATYGFENIYAKNTTFIKEDKVNFHKHFALLRIARALQASQSLECI